MTDSDTNLPAEQSNDLPQVTNDETAAIKEVFQIVQSPLEAIFSTAHSHRMAERKLIHQQQMEAAEQESKLKDKQLKFLSIVLLSVFAMLLGAALAVFFMTGKSNSVDYLINTSITFLLGVVGGAGGKSILDGKSTSNTVVDQPS